MGGEELKKMRKPDQTPLPVVAPQPWSESSGAYPVAVEHRRQTLETRSVLKAVLIPVLVGAGVVGPYMVNSVREDHRQEAKAAMEQVAEKPDSKALQTAQLSAIGKLFGTTDGAYNLEDTQTMMKAAAERARNQDWRLPAAELVDPNRVKISEDGLTFELDGQKYSFAEVRAKEGHVYILAARMFEEDDLNGEDHWHMINPMLVGGAKFKRGMTREQVTTMAHDDARQNMNKAISASGNVLRSPSNMEQNGIRLGLLERK